MAVAEQGVAERRRPWTLWWRDWPVFAQPRRLVVFMGVVLTCAALMGVWSGVLTPIRGDELATFAALAICAGLCVEAMRRLGTPAGLTRDLLGAWWFPTLLLLPPMYSLILPVPVYLLLQFRIRRTVIHRRLFNAASVAVSGFVASLLFHSALVDGTASALRVPMAVTEHHITSVEGASLAALCCAVFTVVNTLIVAVAVHLSSSEAPWRQMLFDREALTVDCVELCVGVTAAVLTGLSPALLALALPPAMLLQRSLLFQQLQTAARTDPKTGLLNASTWEAEAAAELARARQSGRAAALLIIDIDHFKAVNDTYGHLFGDHVLLGVATTIGAQLRKSDVIGRFGGEEFVVLLPDSDMAEACRAAERLRMRIGRMALSANGDDVRITVSLGVAVLNVHGDDLVDLLAAADLALYRAKGAGRNRVCLPVLTRSAVPARQPGPAVAEVPPEPSVVRHVPRPRATEGGRPDAPSGSGAASGQEP
ncbi:GGDEF domain-containing protein [Streptomonospora sp. S1-112]|uniref:GGDEF domain-containing protein n=1 Tax=Streptomonospora mangrovi TaxID=2883123 RepID=A0A9X3NQI2_9ACTN|nr:GGDEF domain-containing protein [Streptomonospora mangrovi]MDA0564890.1 GGDEF domain-containing protein [Streptomonospora mangrovi]